jgi:hypothetical protein
VGARVSQYVRFAASSAKSPMDTQSPRNRAPKNSSRYSNHRVPVRQVLVGKSSIARLRRSDIHEEGSVKIGARRARDFPDIHSASSALRSAMSQYAVAPIHAGGVAMRHVGPRDTT